MKSLESVRKLAGSDNKIILIEEDVRHGKADAVNKIFENAIGDYLIFINSDAMPKKGSISKLLSAIHDQGEKIGVVSGRPFLGSHNGSTSLVEELMWSIHNECSLRMNHMNVSNHCSDEMMVVRMDLLQKLPEGLVNDGAYIAGRAKIRGYSIKFCSEAPVQIDVPERCVDLIRQRRRIIFGHFQIWRLTGRRPKTLESILIYQPKFSASLVVGTFARDPRLIKIVPLALVTEAASIVLGLKDVIFSTGRHKVWERYGN